MRSSSRQRELDRRKTACGQGEEPRGRRGGTAAAWRLARQQGQSPRAHAIPLVLGSSSHLSVAETGANEYHEGGESFPPVEREKEMIDRGGGRRAASQEEKRTAKRTLAEDAAEDEEEDAEEREEEDDEEENRLRIG